MIPSGSYEQYFFLKLLSKDFNDILLRLWKHFKSWTSSLSLYCVSIDFFKLVFCLLFGVNEEYLFFELCSYLWLLAFVIYCFLSPTDNNSLAYFLSLSAFKAKYFFLHCSSSSIYYFVPPPDSFIPFMIRSFLSFKNFSPHSSSLILCFILIMRDWC